MNKFSVVLSNGKEIKGIEFKASNPRANLLIITGMDEHSSRYKDFALSLNDENISVSILDHFGQGENISDISEIEKVPHGSWDMEIEGLKLKIDELKKNNIPVFLMGHSMGSFSTQCFIQRYPKYVNGVIIMGSNGDNNKLMIKLGRVLSKICARGKRWDKQAKLMEKATLGPFVKAVKNRKTDLDWLSYNEENVKNYLNDPLSGAPNTNGFLYEMMYGLSTLYVKKNLLRLSPEEKILIVSGEDDPVGANSKGPISLSKLYKKYGVKDVKIIIYRKMRHEILNENNSEQVIKDILEFIR